MRAYTESSCLCVHVSQICSNVYSDDDELRVAHVLILPCSQHDFLMGQITPCLLFQRTQFRTEHFQMMFVMILNMCAIFSSWPLVQPHVTRLILYLTGVLVFAWKYQRLNPSIWSTFKVILILGFVDVLGLWILLGFGFRLFKYKGRKSRFILARTDLVESSKPFENRRKTKKQ